MAIKSDAAKAKKRENDRKKMQRHRDRRRVAGLCVACGKIEVPSSQYCDSCRKRYRVYTAKWKKNNPDRKRRTIARYRDWHWKVRLLVIEAYGGKCKCCGETELLFLTIDHVNGDGKEHREQIGHQSIYSVVRREGFPKDRYQLLCFNCNIAKDHNGGICPHVRRNYP